MASVTIDGKIIRKLSEGKQNKKTLLRVSGRKDRVIEGKITVHV